ncbi:hypothetical protein ATI61_105512 [Archangium gephyra]|uniref:Hemolysin D n=1 Tax=Archangium gephyra TaxID=48 RepID=A0AAC8QFM4_9BACT|nr:hypothetical protein [Archangium gephyra]AKJ06503.1 Hypothetical protein AA314_08129 [Archangium gephyra]REG32184.1 hypothetical protein ATI61_105512 [Archangium gephyra]
MDKHRFAPIRFALVGLAAALSLPLTARAFTQSGVSFGGLGNSIPMGHEWLTRRAAIELLLGTDPKVPKDPKDPRLTWKGDSKLSKGLAKNLDISDAGSKAEVKRIKSQKNGENRYASTYEFVFDAILGERWVDITGMNVAAAMSGSHNCFDAVAQEPAELQYDHFMRRYDDVGGKGGVDAAKEAQQRFIDYFVAAATAPTTSMLSWDGGGSTTLYTVDRNYFLLGRAAHLLQDSFSLEHVVRTPDDNYSKVRQVKSYLCADGAEQHSHAKPNDYTNGDVIWNMTASWKPGWSTYLPSAMRVNALVAMEASKDLWAAFIRTMGTPASGRADKAKKEAQTLVDNWMHFDESEMSSWYDNVDNQGPTWIRGANDSSLQGQTQSACMLALNVPQKTPAERNEWLEGEQAICLYNIEATPGYDDLWDASTNMPYNWQWKLGNFASDWLPVPSGWKPSPHPADSGVRVQILAAAKTTKGIYVKSLAANQYVKLGNNAPLELIVVGNWKDPNQGAYLRATNAPTLFLSYTAGSSGQVKLWNGTTDSQYVIEDAPSGKAIQNTHWKQYMWYADDGTVHVTKDGDKSKPSAQWSIPGLP